MLLSFLHTFAGNKAGKLSDGNVKRGSGAENEK